MINKKKTGLCLALAATLIASKSKPRTELLHGVSRHMILSETRQLPTVQTQAFGETRSLTRFTDFLKLLTVFIRSEATMLPM